MPTVEQNLQRLALDGVFNVATQGMAIAMEDALWLVTEQFPAVPEDTGALIASGTAFVDKKLVAVNPQEVRAESQRTGEPGDSPTPAMTHSERLDSQAITGMIVFNQSYAEDVHEGGPRNWTTPGTGDKFIEQKLPEIADAALNQVAKELRRYIGA